MYIIYVYVYDASSDIMLPEIGRAHHHGRHRHSQIGALPVVPLNAVVAHHAGRAGVVYAIEIGGAARFKPPACRTNEWVEGKRLIQAHERQHPSKLFVCKGKGRNA